ncbi:hypothetical protein ACFFGH_33990 [Lysobacter korlensis]|uniref:Uncharacterized protein n=1 Tax=Lysobacter korlensis TaxID=553636 RepID=A0ABV6S0V5_9GAMM
MGILLLAGGVPMQLESALALAKRDWRDLLAAAGLANADWPVVLQRALAPELLQNEA